MTESTRTIAVGGVPVTLPAQMLAINVFPQDEPELQGTLEELSAVPGVDFELRVSGTTAWIAATAPDGTEVTVFVPSGMTERPTPDDDARRIRALLEPIVAAARAEGVRG